MGTVAHDGPARTTANHLGRGTPPASAHERNDDRTALSLFAGIVRRLSAHPRADDGKFPILLAVFPVADYYPLKQAALVHNPIAYIPAPSSVSGAGVTLVMQHKPGSEATGDAGRLALRDSSGRSASSAGRLCRVGGVRLYAAFTFGRPARSVG